MTTLLIILGIIFLIIGIVGCIIPGLPGPPLAYIALILLQFTESTPFTSNFMLIWASIVILFTLLDYYVPVWGTQKFGGSKYGMWGSIIGLVLGLSMGPLGIILGPFFGAFIGELIGGENADNALRAGFGAFLGFVAGTIMKLGVTIMIVYYFVVEAWGMYF
ncbi:MAG: DUF456 domain-containing protein [Bacteroidetes bacterium]|nr:MAG: DUF456 domain-containing protein [Bacteroidota bacterium]